jgi:uncharacterized membrane protein YqjE
MLTVPGTFTQLAAASKRFAQRVLTIGENRIELLVVEVQEERDRLLRAILLALGIAAFGLLAGITLTLGVAVWLWNYSPGLALLILMLIYVAIAVVLYTRLTRLRRNWKLLPATLEQLNEDCKCLRQNTS